MPKNLKFSVEALRRHLDGRPRTWLRSQTGMPELRIRDIFNGVEPKASELMLIARAFRAQPQDFMIEIDIGAYLASRPQDRRRKENRSQLAASG